MDNDWDNRIVYDANGFMYFVTHNGTKIQVRDSEEAKKLEELEAEMEWYQRFPMGMK
jgi:hypothetical protein